MEKFNLAVSRFYRKKYNECILICDEILNQSPNDLSTQLLKTHSIRKKNYVDHLEADESTLGELILDEHSISNLPRPGTSLNSMNSRGEGGNRPISQTGRPMSGVVRPGTIQRVGTSSGSIIRAGTGTNNLSRATTSGGRYLRIATASLQSLNSNFSLDPKDINPKTIVLKKSLSKAVADYLFYVEKNYKLLLEIASEATQANNYNDWWWKYNLGKVFYKIGQLQDGEKQLLSALKSNSTYPYIGLQLSALYKKMNQPLKSIEILKKVSLENEGEIYYKIYEARIQELLLNFDISVSLYKEVLLIDNCNFEAIACIGSNHFYENNPEIALSFYKRLFELGINSAEVLNNLGLCAFFSNQFNLCISCFERGLLIAEDEIASDIWYNIAYVAIFIGDIPLAYQALKISLTYNEKNSEAFNNLGVLEFQKGEIEKSKSNLLSACGNNETIFEPHYNYALLKFKKKDLEEAYKYINKSLEINPNHFESKELLEVINKKLLE